MPDFTNMLSWPQWVILGLVPPAIVLLYFLKLKRRPIVVPSTYLWHKSIEDLHVNAVWQRLRRNILLWLQLLLIALAMGALLRPSWQGLKFLGGRSIFLIDNSASMSATDEKPSRLEEAKRQVRDLLEQMRSGDAAMLISFADTARVEQSYTNDADQLEKALKNIRPTARCTSLLEALKLASGLANPGRSAYESSDTRVAEALPATVYIFSDGKFPPVTGFSLGNLKPKFVPLGSAGARNVGILALSAERNETRPDWLQVYARLENFSAEKQTVRMELLLDGQLKDADKVEVAPGEPQGVKFDLLGVESGTLRLRLKTDDQLPVDDKAYLVLAPPRRGCVLLVTAGDEPLEMVLQTSSAKELAEVRVEPVSYLATKKYAAEADTGIFDLVIYDGCRPKKMPLANTLLIGEPPPSDKATPPSGRWRAEPSVVLPQIIDVDAIHPLMQWLDLGDVTLYGGRPLTPPPGAKTLVYCDAGPMAAVAPRDVYEDLVLGFRIMENQTAAGGAARQIPGTDWYKKASFPVFFRNLLEYFSRQRAQSTRDPLQPGRAVTLEAPQGGAVLQVRTPTGKKIDLKTGPSGRVLFTDTKEIGIYQVLSGGKTFQRFAVDLFDPGESDIRPNPSPSIKVGDIVVAGENRWQADRKEIWKYLVLIGLVVLGIEWYIYNRRIF
ncbi:MAG: BatA and WFA domain-containing protein [Pirellulales bacterium]|nr:BatA and WFA domain-containing protein [Pirellulales bacterium]